jgi:hypothetical protein
MGNDGNKSDSTTNFQPLVNGLTELQLQQILSIMRCDGASQSVAPKTNNVNRS